MSLHVECQVIGAGEAAAAHAALERLGPGVFPEMASQLVGTGEAPLTSLPGALVRLLSFSTQEEKKKKSQMKPRQTDNTYLDTFPSLLQSMEYFYISHTTNKRVEVMKKLIRFHTCSSTGSHKSRRVLSFSVPSLRELYVI